MNGTNIISLINNPNELNQLPLHELEALVKKYPYCQNFRVLMALKSQWDNSNSFKKQEELASTFSFDRAYLRKLLFEGNQITFKEPVEIVRPENVPKLAIQEEEIDVDEEEIIEFPSLNKLEEAHFIAVPTEEKQAKEQQPALEIVEEPITNTVEWDHIAELDEIEDPKILEIEHEPVEIIQVEIQEEITSEIIVEKINEKIIPIPEKIIEPEIVKEPEVIEEKVVVEEKKMEVVVPDPATISEAALLKQRIRVLEAELAVVKAQLKEDEPIPVEKPKKEKEKQAPTKASRSLEKSDSIISETLAKILEKQGYYKRSKKMYEQLSLIFPEKSAYFAEKIQSVENLIANKK